VIRFTREKAARPRSGPLVGIGNPDLGRSALDLAYAEQEVASLRARFPAATLLLGAEATRGRVRLLAPGARVLHFATHAELDDRDPLGSAILLAPSDGTNGRLEVHEIYGWSLAAELVVLSACETALGPVSEGDELVGLARAFIYAGAPSVVATLWQVDDRASAALMDRFYAGFATGATKAHALRAAQFEALRELGDPFFWAAYQLTGDGG
jgi:CHAT domain-containing protein